MLHRHSISSIRYVMGGLLRFLWVQIGTWESWEKAELRKAEKTMSIIIENKDDIARLAAQILFETQKEKEDKNDTGTTE